MLVKHVMTKSPVTLRATDKLETALRLFTKHQITGCPVVSRNAVVGMVTQSDVLNAIDVHSRIYKTEEFFSLISAAIKGEKYGGLKKPINKLLQKPVKNFMTSPVITINDSEDVYSAARLINKHDVQRLPVTRNKKLVGIVTRTDIVSMLNELKNK